MIHPCTAPSRRRVKMTAQCFALSALLAGSEALTAAEMKDWNEMSAHEQFLAVQAGHDVVPDPQPIVRSSERHPSAAVVAADHFPGKTVIQSSCVPGLNDRSKITGEINPSCYWHEGSQTGNPHLRGHPILGPTDHESHFWHGLHKQTASTTTAPTPVPTRGAADVLEHSVFLSEAEHTAICHKKDITSCARTGWCAVNSGALPGEHVCEFDATQRIELVAPVQHPQCLAGKGLSLFPALDAANNVCCHYACGQCSECNETIVPFQVIDTNVKKCQEMREPECTAAPFCTFATTCDFDRTFTKAAMEEAKTDPLITEAVHPGMSNKFFTENCCVPTIRAANVPCTGNNVPCVLKAVTSENGD